MEQKKEMTKEQAHAWHSMFVRIVQLGENLMLRQMPSEVSPETARRCYAAAKEFYLAVDEDTQEVERLIGKEAGGDV